MCLSTLLLVRLLFWFDFVFRSDSIRRLFFVLNHAGDSSLFSFWYLSGHTALCLPFSSIRPARSLAVLALVPHCHMGMQQVLMDYVHPRKFGVIGTAANVLLGCATALTLLGLLKLALFDGGVCKTVKQMIHA